MFFVSGGNTNGLRNTIIQSLGFMGLLVFSAPAHADSTFLLQLGTFNTEAQATQKWDEVKSRNSDLLGNMTLHVAEVALPPDNAISYRTQAGPIASHDQAATLCNTLQTRGMECYVVETAIFTGDQPPVSAAALAQQPPSATATPAPPLASPPVMDGLPAASPAAAAPAVIASAPEAAPAPATAPVPIPAAETTPPPSALPSDNSALWQAQAIASGATPPPLTSPPAAASAPVLPPGSVVPGREPRMLGASASPPPAPQPIYAPPPPLATDTQPAPEKHGFFSSLFGSSPKPASSGEVNVAEAIRVPLGSGAQQKKAVLPNLPAVHGLGGYPSQAFSQKAYWAQLSYFSSEEQARGFYENFHAAYPQFSDGVRVRITRPYAGSSRAGHISLRVGPFVGTNDLQTICAAANARGLRCTIVRDMGSSEMGSTVRTRHSLAVSGYEQRSQNMDAQESSSAQASAGSAMYYWAQLGSYRSYDEAMDTWKDIQDNHKKLLGRVHATAASPAMSSSARQLYRLRAGPFVSEAKANALCEGLQESGASCLVIHDR